MKVFLRQAEAQHTMSQCNKPNQLAHNFEGGWEFCAGTCDKGAHLGHTEFAAAFGHVFLSVCMF